jgi:hypothetical protein
VKTDLTRGHGIEAADSVRGILARLDALSMENSGSFWHATTSEVLPW